MEGIIVKKLLVTLMMMALLALPAVAMADGFSGAKVEAKTVTIAELANLNDDAKVYVEGKLTRELGDDKYELKDDSGATVTVKIKPRLFDGITVSPNDTLIIYGDLDKGDYGSMKVEAKRIDFKR